MPLVGGGRRRHRPLHRRRHLARRRKILLVEGGGSGGGRGRVAVVMVGVLPRPSSHPRIAAWIKHYPNLVLAQPPLKLLTLPKMVFGARSHFNTVKSQLNGCPDDGGGGAGQNERTTACGQWQRPKTRTSCAVSWRRYERTPCDVVRILNRTKPPLDQETEEGLARPIFPHVSLCRVASSVVAVGRPHDCPDAPPTAAAAAAAENDGSCVSDTIQQ